MTGSGGNTPFKAIQEGAAEIYRTALRRCSSFRNPGTTWTAAMAERRASRQQTENLKWQQDMFVRLINLAGLCKEGLVSDNDVSSFRQKILDHIVVCYDGGEYAQVTRDKLIFLQDLLYARCISEEDYHTAKRSLLYRLASQGAEINTTDIIFACTAAQSSAPSTPHARNRMEEISAATERLKGAENIPITQSKSPVKQLISRLMNGGKAHNERPRVPHAMDFVRSRDCPLRDAPTAPEFDISDQCGSPLFHSPTASISSKESSSKADSSRFKDEQSPRKTPVTRNLFPASQKSPLSGEKPSLAAEPKSTPPGEKPCKSPLKRNPITSIIRKLHGEDGAEQESKGKINAKAEKKLEPVKVSTTPKKAAGSGTPKKPWRLDMLRPPRLVTNRQESAAETADSTSEPVVLSPKRAPRANPDNAKPKTKLHSKGKSADFYIDKVLGENIKKELERIRNEMNKSTTTQAFTNNQIDSIATRLPVDKAELMRFFPKSWCDRYGDIVLDVVHKEFKGHVQDMEKIRKDKQRQTVENDENSGTNSNCDGNTISKATSNAAGTRTLTPKGKSSSMNRCFTTTDNSSPRNRGAGTPRKVTSYNSNAEQYEKELDGKLCAEIEKLPNKKRTPIRV